MAISDFIEDLIYRVLAGRASDVDRQELESWLLESEEHRAFFEKVERTWYTGKYAMKWKNMETCAAWKAVERKRAKRYRGRLLRIGWRVAAVAVFVVGITWMILSSGGRIPIVAEQFPVGKPGETKAVLILSSGVHVELGNGLVDTIRENGLPILRKEEYIDYRPDGVVKSGEVVYNELIVPVGGEYRLLLADGTVVYMNSESRIKYPVRFTNRKRVVELEGEAYFDVARDEESPFMVHTKRLDVTVLGTGFNVMAYEKDPRTEVTLVNGKVNVTSGEHEEVLTPNHQFVLDNESREYVVKSVNVNTYVDWKNGILNFDAMPLDELCDKLGRWYEVSFFFSKESLKKMKFSGAFKKYNDINYIFSLIEATTSVTFKMNGNVIIVNEK